MTDYSEGDIVTAYECKDRKVTIFRNAKVIGKPPGYSARAEYLVLPEGSDKPIKLLVHSDGQENPEEYAKQWEREMQELREATKGRFITDDELRAAGVSELDIDALDRNLPTQKNNTGNRDRKAVEAVLRTRRSGK